MHWAGWADSFGVGTRRGILAACSLLITIGALRITSTYAIFSPTNDERTNIGSGMEWLTEGSYNGDPTNPPLARVLIALGPFLERNVLNQRSDVGAGVPTGQPGMTAHRRVQIADLSGE